ncbi:dCMP deaminase [Cerasibacillus quisquiliarum]|uniref:ComE operon protein 2 n=1 Tax=Cerasibacillus quisquiliarum TaxID=227865 RepID=A0A511UZ58_9BACI|nr:ComE operon protein 2 [Cerasibacillus quisquiliarum]MBB5145563.1 dCMP deaminase [Cerasibacillus quisquiliarum]GEN31041.1 ComE operon protein 2 [Cerasibacillus quisquiliarum]
MKRIPWDQYFMAQSHLLALRSTCTRLMVGATIVREKRIIAGGYNGSVSGSVHCVDEGCYVVDGHCVRTVHAEANALLQCAKFGVATEGAHIYVTHFPCLQCTKQIIQAGIHTVYYANDYRNDPYAIELFKEANIHVEKVTVDKVSFDPQRELKEAYVSKLIDTIEALGASKEKLKLIKEEGKQLFSHK